MAVTINGSTGISGVDGSAGTPAVQGADANTGVFFPAADTIAVSTNGSERVRIDTAGITKFRSTGSAYDSTPGDGVSDGLYLQVDSSGIAHIDSYAGGGSTNLALGTNSGGGAVVERMRIDSSGNLLVGTTSAYGSRFQVTRSGGTPAAIHNSGGTSGSFNQILFLNNAGTADIGYIARTNDTSVSYTTTSDYRLKEAVQPMTGALARVAALKPVTYKWKADGSDGQGFIAHELQAVVPDCVSGEKDAVDADGKPVYQGIDTSFLVATLTAAIQEQQALIAALQADVAALKGAQA